jgi:hypothetical protein
MSELIMIGTLIVVGLVVIGLLLILVLFRTKKEDKMREPNYQVFFIIGVSWIPIGVVFMITINIAIGIAFLAMGAIYQTIGLANSDKWEKKQ